MLNVELFKLLRRPMTWILGAVIAIIIMFIYLSFLLVLETGSSEMDPQDIEDFEEFIALPSTTTFGYDLSFQMAAIMSTILVASALTTEFGWRTVITMVAWTGDRLRFISAKLVLAALAALLFVALGFVASVAGSLTTSILHGSLSLSDLGLAYLGDVALGAGRTWLAVLVYAALAAVIAMLTRSTAAAIAITLALLFLESLGVLILDLLPDPLPRLQDLLLSTNTAALLAENGSLQGLTDEENGGPDVSAWRATFFLLGFCAACVAVTLRTFARRDINV
jgi:hypothetical protein